MAHYRKALELDPSDPRVHHDLGMALFHQGQFDQAVQHLSEALKRLPNGLDLQYTAVGMREHLGEALLYAGKPDEAIRYFSEAIRLDPNRAEAYYNVALVLAGKGDIDQTLQYYTKAVKLKPSVDRSPMLHYLLGMKYAEARRFHEAVMATQRALDLAQAAGNTQSVQEISKRLELYKQLDSSSQH
jgi:tetratricopeptide (TPR) repeat protein